MAKGKLILMPLALPVMCCSFHKETSMISYCRASRHYYLKPEFHFSSDQCPNPDITRTEQKNSKGFWRGESEELPAFSLTLCTCNERIYTIFYKTEMDYLSYRSTCPRQHIPLPSDRKTDCLVRQTGKNILNQCHSLPFSSLRDTKHFLGYITTFSMSW